MAMRNQGVGSWPARRARMTPDRVALIHEARTVTYRQLHDRATRLAQGLRDLGVRGGDRVAYLGPNHPAFVETMFAAGMLGAIILPLNTRLAAPELAYIAGDAAADLLVWASEMADTVRALGAEHQFRALVSVGGPDFGYEGYDQLIAGADSDLIDEVVAMEDVCMIQYTSGTSGR